MAGMMLKALDPWIQCPLFITWVDEKDPRKVIARPQWIPYRFYLVLMGLARNTETMEPKLEEA